VASNTAASENRRKRKHRKSGHRRKAKESVRSTLSAAELFAACGEPGKPVSAK
jgi:hypothetical protein